jgi:hypothetical protein
MEAATSLAVVVTVVVAVVVAAAAVAEVARAQLVPLALPLLVVSEVILSRTQRMVPKSCRVVHGPTTIAARSSTATQWRYHSSNPTHCRYHSDSRTTHRTG